MQLDEVITVGWEAKTELTKVCSQIKVCSMAVAGDGIAISGAKEGCAAGSGSAVSPPADSGAEALVVARAFAVLWDPWRLLDPRREGDFIARHVSINTGCSSRRS